MKVSKRIKKIADYDLLKIILTSFITVLLTLASSYYLMFSQLKEEQKYWKTRTKVERVQEYLDKQISLMEDINTGLLINEVLARDYKLFAASYMYNIELAIEYSESMPDGMVLELETKSLEYHKKINEIASKFQMCELFFGPEVDSILIPLTNALNENYGRNLAFKDSLVQNNKSSYENYFEKDFETSKELSEQRLSLLMAMRAEIESATNILYFDILSTETIN